MPSSAITAEAAQLCETELGTLILYVQGVSSDWRAVPDPESAQAALDRIERSTLGGLISALNRQVGIDENTAERFASALQARNRLNHGCDERHNFKLEIDEERNEMFADLEGLHTELFNALQVACTMMALATKALENPEASE
jgi:hypothetical protein